MSKLEDAKKNLKGKNIAVIGLGISGEGVLFALKRLGANAFVFDRKEPDSLEYGRYMPLESAGDHNYDLAVISPGVPLTSPEAGYFIEAGIPMVGEVEFAYGLCDSEFICITGTNGKTTTTSLVGEIFEKSGAKSDIAGNIGIAVCPLAFDNRDEIILEVSSFQIETLRDFKSKICAVLNITPDHLDRHGSFEAYAALKLDLLSRAEQKIVNADCPVLAKWEREERDRCKDGNEPDSLRNLWHFSRKTEPKRGAFVRDGKIYTRGINKCSAANAVSVAGKGNALVGAVNTPSADAMGEDALEYICDISDITLLGSHNVENVLAAALISRLGGISPEDIRRAVREFKAVEHRIEYVTEVRGVRFYNDSKGTNPDSSIKAIEAMDMPIHLIAGGYEKNSDFTEFLEIGRAKIKTLSLIGVTAERFRQTALKVGYSDDAIRILPDMKSAVKNAFDAAKAGDAVLLSPASASWGMYPNFEERGRDFKRCVRDIAAQND